LCQKITSRCLGSPSRERFRCCNGKGIRSA